MEENYNIIENVAVFCASSDGVDPEIFKMARIVGEVLAKRDIRLIYGGSKLGLMGQVAAGVMENGGFVTGVIPEFLKTKEVVHT